MAESEKYSLAKYKKWVAAGNVKTLFAESLEIDNLLNRIDKKKS